MFRTAASRIPLRRALHTSALRFASSSRVGRVGVAVGASAAVAYLTWRSQTIALDSAGSPSKRGTSQTPRSPEPQLSSQTASTEPDTSLHEKHDAPPPAEDSFSSESNSPSSPAALPEPVGEAVEEGEEENGGGGGAYNPVTGEINWDCPCLGGMAHGPCGMQFREAFSCFVYSEQEPKGIDCVEKFKAMQDCFREHPDVYGEDIMDDDDDEPVEIPAGAVDDHPAPAPGSTLQSDQGDHASSHPVEPIQKKRARASESTVA